MWGEARCYTQQMPVFFPRVAARRRALVMATLVAFAISAAATSTTTTSPTGRPTPKTWGGGSPASPAPSCAPTTSRSSATEPRSRPERLRRRAETLGKHEVLVAPWSRLVFYAVTVVVLGRRASAGAVRRALRRRCCSRPDACPGTRGERPALRRLRRLRRPRDPAHGARQAPALHLRTVPHGRQLRRPLSPTADPGAR